jgi:Beta-L-arabinofuranosidase, GH127 middle domain
MWLALDRYAATDVNFVRVVDPHNALRRAERAKPTTTRTSQGRGVRRISRQGPWLVLTWLNVLFAVGGDARALDLAEFIVYNVGSAGPTGDTVYASDKTTLFVNFFVAREEVIRVADTLVRVGQRTDYPRSGDLELRIEPHTRAIFTIAVRFPGWTRGQLPWGDRYRFESAGMPAPTLMVNGEAVRMTFDRGFAKVTREWRSGDTIYVFFPMREHRVVPRSPEQNTPCDVMQRGPIVWCRSRP